MNVGEAKASEKKASQRVRSYALNAWRKPRWAAMDFLSRFALIRRLLRLNRTQANPQFLTEESVLKGVSASSAHIALKRDGYVAGLQLPDDIVAELTEFSNTHHCYGNKKLDQGFLFKDLEKAQRAIQSHFSIAIYHRVEEKLPVIARLAEDPLIMQIAANYFCTKPVFTGCRLWWTFPAGDDFDSSLSSAFFHADRDDYSALRLFFYLTDVDELAGAHELVRGSHKKKRLRDLFSLAERDVDKVSRTYGEENLVRITGKAGLGFLEDPFIFHRATLPKNKPRLILQLRYATRDNEQFDAPDLTKLQAIKLG